MHRLPTGIAFAVSIMTERRNPLPASCPARPSLELTAPVPGASAPILTQEALAFVALLEQRFGGRRRLLLQRRAQVQARLDMGWNPDFLPETRTVREGNWRVAPVPAEIADRRVEITGPTDRKMVINALNSGAQVFMADFEDSNAPTWKNLIAGQPFSTISAARR